MKITLVINAEAGLWGLADDEQALADTAALRLGEMAAERVRADCDADGVEATVVVEIGSPGTAEYAVTDSDDYDTERCLTVYLRDFVEENWTQALDEALQE